MNKQTTHALTAVLTSVLTALAIAAFSVSSANASATIQPTALKHMAVSADAKVWKADVDGKDGSGDLEFRLDHLKFTQCFINFTEIKTKETPEQAWRDFKLIGKSQHKEFKEVPMPASFKVPAGFTCNASEPFNGSPMIDIVCSRSTGAVLLSITPVIFKQGTTCLQDSNQVLSTLQIK
jgi:hypothetical protein